MKKTLSVTLQILGGVFAVLLLVLAGLTVAVNSPAIQQKVLHTATVMLSERLGSKATIDSVYINLARQDLELYGVGIDDQQQRKLFEMEQMVVDLDLKKLLASKIEVEHARIRGIRANIVAPPGEDPNYQSLLDALKKDKAPADTAATKRRSSRLKFDLRDINLQDVKLTYNDIDLNLESVGASLDASLRGHGSIKDVTLSYEDNVVHVDRLEVQFGERWKETGFVENLRTRWTAQTKKGPVEKTLEIDRLQLQPEGGVGKLRLSRLHYTTNNHLPRKNVPKPKRGAFDTGHFNVWADLEASLDMVNKDTVLASIVSGSVTDTLTGIFIRDMRGKVSMLNGVTYVKDLAFRHLNTHVSVDSARMQLPSKKRGTRFAFTTGTITVNTLLKDIATAFAPVLKNFRMPLSVTTSMTGNEDGMTFGRVHVFTTDKQLDIRAKGGISNLKDKYKLAVRFDIASLRTYSPKVMEIINQFAVKKLMTDQLKSLSTIDYSGQVGIYWKNERFSGKLRTDNGTVDFKLSLDENDKYIDGNVDTDAFDVGNAFKVKAIGSVAFTGDFRADFSKVRTAQIRKDKNGKLPIATAQIQVREAHVGKLRLTDIFADIESDGATALLNIDRPGKLADVGFDIRYTSTTHGTKVKVKPKLHFNIFKQGEASGEK